MTSTSASPTTKTTIASAPWRTTPTRIARNPGDASVRRHRFQSVDAWAVTIPGDDEDWVTLWAPHETEPDIILVPYVGPASFA